MKTLEVFPRMTLAQLQQRFHELYPNLRLEPLIELSAPERPLVCQTMNQGSLLSSYCRFFIKDTMTLSKLNACFQTCFGFGVRVTRWTGDNWQASVDILDKSLAYLNQKKREKIRNEPAFH